MLSWISSVERHLIAGCYLEINTGLPDDQRMPLIFKQIAEIVHNSRYSPAVQKGQRTARYFIDKNRQIMSYII